MRERKWCKRVAKRRSSEKKKRENYFDRERLSETIETMRTDKAEVMRDDE